MLTGLVWGHRCNNASLDSQILAGAIARGRIRSRGAGDHHCSSACLLLAQGDALSLSP